MTLIGEQTFFSEGEFEGFRSTAPYTITPLAPVDTEAKAGGAAIAQLLSGKAMSKYGEYGVEFERIETAGKGFGGRQAGAINPRFGKFVKLNSREDFLAASLNPEANTTYTFDGFKYKTDGMGRALSSEGELGYSPRNRFPNIDASIGKTGNSGDIGFHLGADRFGFQGGPLNVVPGNGNLNSSAYKAIENELAGYVAEGKRVNATFEAVYNRGNKTVRPDAFVVRYKVGNGSYVEREFMNRPGG